MTRLLEANWIWILLIGAMLYMHFGRHGGHMGHMGHMGGGNQRDEVDHADHGTETTVQDSPDTATDVKGADHDHQSAPNSRHHQGGC